MVEHCQAFAALRLQKRANDITTLGHTQGLDTGLGWLRQEEISFADLRLQNLLSSSHAASGFCFSSNTF